MTSDSSPLVLARFEKEHRAPTKIYRRAILQAIESFQDFHSRSNLDSVRRHTQAILQAQESDFRWNDTIFMKALKSVADNGDVDLSSNFQAELSPTYKRKRADSLTQRMVFVNEVESESWPQCPLSPPNQHHSIARPGESPRAVPKEPPNRPREHDKWKIMPKKIFEKTLAVNPMDTM